MTNPKLEVLTPQNSQIIFIDHEPQFGLPLESVAVKIGDTSLPFGSFAGGSSQTASLGAAINAASNKLAGELLRLARDTSEPCARRPIRLSPPSSFGMSSTR